MGILVYECYNEYNEDAVKFFKSNDGNLKITEGNGSNQVTQNEYTIDIDKDSVEGLINFLKNQFNIE